MSNIAELSKEELLEMVEKQKQKDDLRKQKMKVYIAKYQQTTSGREKYVKASKKYYDKNREKILEKKRAAYRKKMEELKK
tara:strand:- start:231 stop:470 length:240 start_codon:yes stop_codon:yes gene_type:complete